MGIAVGMNIPSGPVERGRHAEHVDAIVAINSMPQHEVANGKGQIEFLLARPTTLFNDVAKNPSPGCPSGMSAMEISFSSFISFTLYDTGRDIKSI